MKIKDRRFKYSVYPVVGFVLLLWFIKSLEHATGTDFSNFGILPRTLHGSIGIFTSPLIHGDYYHLLSNTFPLLILGVGLLYFYPRIGFQVIGLIYIMTGFWVWVAAREAMHIGASGIVYGMFAFLLIGGFIRKDRRTLSISFVLLFLYGGSMFSGLLPTTTGISWESHLMGFFAGVFCAIYFRNEPIVFLEEETKPKMVNDVDAFNSTFDETIHFNYTYTTKKVDKNE